MPMGERRSVVQVSVPAGSPEHQRAAVQRLVRPATATATATDKPAERATTGGGSEVVELPTESTGGARSRTAHLGIMSGKKRDGERQH